MGYTHRQFLRVLGNAAGDRPYRVDGSRVVVDAGGGRSITVVLEPEGVRRIASIALPMTTVHFEFAGYGEGQAASEMEKFLIHFHKGGG